MEDIAKLTPFYSARRNSPKIPSVTNNRPDGEGLAEQGIRLDVRAATDIGSFMADERRLRRPDGLGRSEGPGEPNLQGTRAAAGETVAPRLRVPVTAYRCQRL